MLATKNPYIKSAYQQLQIISQDEQKRLEYEAREKAVRDYNQSMFEAEQRGIEIGEQRGIELKSTEIAKKLFDLGYPMEQIILITGLSENQIDELR